MGFPPISGQPIYESIYGNTKKATFQKVNNSHNNRIRWNEEYASQKKRTATPAVNRCKQPNRGLLVKKVVKTVRTQTDVITTVAAAAAAAETRTPRNEVEVDLVGKTDATSETVAEYR